MAALAYVLLPFSGMLAYFSWAGSRVRFHGAQAICFGSAWALLLFAASAASAVLTQIVAAVGAGIWLVLIVGTALGRDLRIPGVGALCARAVGLEQGS